MKPIIDLSYYQSPSAINYDLMCAAISGVIIRCAYGSGAPGRWEGADIEFDRHYAEFSARGMPIGAYQFITEYQDIEKQVEVMRQATDDKVLKLGLWADVELENNAEPLTRNTVDRYLDLTKGVVGGIYTSAYQWKRIMNVPYYANYLLWVAHYGAVTPLLPLGANGYWLWQTDGSGTGRIPGYSKGIDINRFYGTDAQFQAWVNSYNEPEEPPVEPEEPPVEIPVTLPYEAKVTANVLIVRDAASGADTKGRLQGGKHVTVYEESGNWARINAWVSRDWIERVTNIPPVVPPSGTLEVALYQARVTADVLNVRSSPEIADNVVGQLTEGAIVDVFEEREV